MVSGSIQNQDTSPELSTIFGCLALQVVLEWKKEGNLGYGKFVVLIMRKPSTNVLWNYNNHFQYNIRHVTKQSLFFPSMETE